ncbi:MAG: hypothetical protein OCC49_07980 [Fibrobacterales bacterium]
MPITIERTLTTSTITIEDSLTISDVTLYREEILASTFSCKKIQWELGSVNSCDVAGIQLLIAAKKMFTVQNILCTIGTLNESISEIGTIIGVTVGTLFENKPKGDPHE